MSAAESGTIVYTFYISGNYPVIGSYTEIHRVLTEKHKDFFVFSVNLCAFFVVLCVQEYIA
jgi:hypothetical protein